MRGRDRFVRQLPSIEKEDWTMGRLDLDAINELLAAADDGCADAEYDVALMYATGHGAPQDNVLAHMWFNLAALHGNRHARDERRDIAYDMSEAEVSTAQRLARERVTVPDEAETTRPH
jgi:TPR repeat protein